MATEVTINTREDITVLQQRTEAGHFVDTGVTVFFNKVASMEASRGLSRAIIAWKKEFKENISIEIQPLRRLLAIKAIIKSLRAATKLIDEDDAKIRGYRKFHRLHYLGEQILNKAGRLPRAEEREVKKLAYDMLQAAEKGMAKGYANRKWIRAIGAKIAVMQAAPIVLRPGPAA